MINSRTENAVKNVKVMFICQTVSIFFSFISRTIFSNLLGTEYLGVNGLFSSILLLLSFVELGIGNALIYKLYKPIHNGDIEQIKTYMRSYKIIYRVIMAAIFVIGLSFVPFLDFFIKEVSIAEDIRFIYLLFLINTLSTYIFVYKKSMIIADQKNYIVAIYQQSFTILMHVVQTILLIFTHNYVFYLVSMIVCNILNNFFMARKANKLYPFLLQKPKMKMSSEDKKSLFEDTKGLFLTKIASTILESTDKMVISAFINVSTVGIVSNYTMITQMVVNFLNQVISSITSSIGNLAVQKNSRNEYLIFKRLYFANAMLFGYVCIGMFLLLKFFVCNIWLNGDYTLSTLTVTVIILEVLLRGMHFTVYTFRTATGYFSQLKIVHLLGAILNVILDIILIQYIGLAGVFIGTIIARTIIRMSDVYVLFSNEFQMPIYKYYLIECKYLICFILVIAASLFMIQRIHLSGIVSFVCAIAIITIIFIFITIVLFYRSDEFQYLIRLLLKRKKG